VAGGVAYNKGFEVKLLARD